MVFTLSVPTMAQETPVDEMFRVMSMDKQMAGGFEAMLPMIDQMGVKFKLNNEGKEELKEIFRTWFNEDIDRSKIMSEITQAYFLPFSIVAVVIVLVLLYLVIRYKNIVNTQKQILEEKDEKIIWLREISAENDHRHLNKAHEFEKNIQAHLSGREDNSALIYALISFQEWYKMYINH